METFKEKEKQAVNIIRKFALSFVIIIFLFQTVGIIGAGKRGVHLRFGAVTGKILDEGLYFKIPIVEGVKVMNVRIQKEEVNAPSASKDLQEVDLSVALNYHLKSDRVSDVYQTLGNNYKPTLIIPAIQESIKASSAQFTAEELITKRQEVGNKIKLSLIEKLGVRGISVDELSIVTLDFSPAFNKAIEAKVTAEQEALTAKNKLEQIRFEAEQEVVKAQGVADARIAEAKAEAEAIRIQTEAITRQGGEEYVQLKAIEKWSGNLPIYFLSDGVVPFLNLDK